MLSTKPSRVVIRVIGESFLISFGGIGAPERGAGADRRLRGNESRQGIV